MLAKKIKAGVYCWLDRLNVLQSNESSTMSRHRAPDTIFELAFANCYLSDDRPRSVRNPVISRAIPFLSFDDDYYREPGPPKEQRVTSKFKAAKAICDFSKDGPTSLEFWKLFRTLPSYVRNKIYKLLIFAWSPDAQWARLSRNGRRFAVSRKTSAHPLRPAHYLSDDILGVTKEDLADWTKEKNWEQAECLLDFFKLNEYRNIQRLVWFVEEVESKLQLDDAEREMEARDTKGNGREVQMTDGAGIENVNLWEDVVAFFWDNVIIDFGERLHYNTLDLMKSSRQKDLNQEKCTTKDNHEEVKHICLRLSSIWHSNNHTVHNIVSDHCGVCRFLLLCEFITEHFQNVKSLLLYISITTADLHYLFLNSELAAKDVVGAIRALKVSKEFDVRVRVINGDERKDDDVDLYEDSYLDDFSDEARIFLVRHLLPDTILQTQETRQNTPVVEASQAAVRHDSA
ncbi:hypothetical protein SBOR_1476 [Sclerotinia borealis F-4128]|uniref:Uncharacterized protein n=1 Tax=Sclerotinia borealis (strain F-4128) TaxID=1432307 RepID=W9CMR4_SCLBF|nr:hypothetical protein SBOR_1476 [Sclerotinia borealis F-4128]